MSEALRFIPFISTALFRALLRQDRPMGFWRWPASGRCRGRKSERSGRHSAYRPHQSERERVRRLWQVHQGQLSGRCGPRLRSAFVSDEARLTAHGLVPPAVPTIIRPGSGIEL